ncbi:MAG: OmpH family outer membrane protein [Planctomycetota bacterium]|nr:OmpH family outer membrane protein [Planctomycetota bacterium]
MRIPPIAVTLLAGAVLVATWAAVAPSQPVSIGCVNIERLFENLDAIKSLEVRRAKVQSELAARIDAKKAELVEMQEELESYAPGTPAYETAASHALEKAGELKAIEGYAELKMEAERANAMRDLYTQVKTVTAQVAAEQKLDIIFVDDASPPIQPANLAGTMEQINGRRMLFSASPLDITDLLVQRVNAALKSQSGG